MPRRTVHAPRPAPRRAAPHSTPLRATLRSHAGGVIKGVTIRGHHRAHDLLGLRLVRPLRLDGDLDALLEQHPILQRKRLGLDTGMRRAAPQTAALGTQRPLRQLTLELAALEARLGKKPSHVGKVAVAPHLSKRADQLDGLALPASHPAEEADEKASTVDLPERVAQVGNSRPDEQPHNRQRERHRAHRVVKVGVANSHVRDDRDHPKFDKPRPQDRPKRLGAVFLHLNLSKQGRHDSCRLHLQSEFARLAHVHPQIGQPQLAPPINLFSGHVEVG
eukprot:6834588-Prymnesium_polylepis.1